jgi:L-alanine-DL-glutamate epimerase-like enolase superfamily enzyme
MAEGFGLNCEIGTAGNSLLNIANLHVIYSVTNCAYFEWWQPTEAHRFGLVDDIFRNAGGMIEAPTAPGLGYEIDWDFIDSRKVTTLE